MALNLEQILNDYNGTSMVIAGHAEWGFIERPWYIQLPSGTNPDHPALVNHVGSMNPFRGYRIGDIEYPAAMRSDDFIAANFAQVLSITNDEQVSLFIAMLRYTLVENGALTTDTELRGVVDDEVTIQAQPVADDIAARITGMQNGGEIARWVKKYGMTYMHAMVLVFLSRGHHWSPAYEEIYGRLEAASLIQQPMNIKLPSKEQIYRLAMHGFGIKYLYGLTMEHAQNSRMASAIQLRYSPAPAIAGVAHITTCFAALTHMKAERWWPEFERVYHGEIRVLGDAVDMIIRDPTRYHIASKLITGLPRIFLPNRVKVAFETICQFVIGYIGYLGRSHTLSQQKAVSTKSGGARGVGIMFPDLLNNLARQAVRVTNMTSFLSVASTPQHRVAIENAAQAQVQPVMRPDVRVQPEVVIRDRMMAPVPLPQGYPGQQVNLPANRGRADVQPNVRIGMGPAIELQRNFAPPREEIIELNEEDARLIDNGGRPEIQDHGVEPEENEEGHHEGDVNPEEGLLPRLHGGQNQGGVPNEGDNFMQPVNR